VASKKVEELLSILCSCMLSWSGHSATRRNSLDWRLMKQNCISFSSEAWEVQDQVAADSVSGGDLFLTLRWSSCAVPWHGRRETQSFLGFLFRGSGLIHKGSDFVT
jgi:hypothetical protein